MKILKLIIAVLFVFLASTYLYTLVVFLISDYEKTITAYGPFFFGMVIYISLRILRLRFFHENAEWLRVFSHELTHVVFSILSLNRIKSFSVGRQYGGGRVEFYGKPNFVISLTPYCFQLFTFVLLIIRLFVMKKIYPFLDIFIGFFFVFHIITFIKQAGIHQPDIKTHGIIFSFAFIFLINTLFIALVLVVIRNGFPQYGDFMVQGIENAGAFFSYIINRV